VRALEAMQRLERDVGTTVFLRRGLLWRDDETVDDVAVALRSVDAPLHEVEPAEVGRFLHGLRPDDRRAVFQPDAGPVLAAESMRAQLERFDRSGGQRSVATVLAVRRGAAGPVVELADGELAADVVVVAPGPGAGELLRTLGVDLPLGPRLEQVAHVAHPEGTTTTDAMPCWFDGPVAGRPGLYAMPTPGVGYKLGLDEPLRSWSAQDLDRTPDPVLLARLSERVRQQLPAMDPTPFDAQVCSWTESPDNRFVIDRIDGDVVLAVGDGGEGFKFSALMGLVLAELAEGRSPDADVATFGLSRFDDGVPDAPHVLGR
jgi:sarcosine oxidase